VWVLVPTVETTDPNLAYYNDFSQGEAEYARAFEALGAPWQWTPVTMAGARATLEAAREAAGTTCATATKSMDHPGSR